MPVEFLIFGATLAGVALFHRQCAADRGRRACSRSIAYRVAVRGVSRRARALAGLAAHFAHEWVILANLFLLLVGFALLAAQFEAERAAEGAAALPARRLDRRRSRCSRSYSSLSAFLDNIAAALIGGRAAHTLFRGRVRRRLPRRDRRGRECRRRGQRHRRHDDDDDVDPGVPPLDVLHAYVAAVVAFLVFALPAARAQQRFAPIVREARAGLVDRLAAGRDRRHSSSAARSWPNVGVNRARPRSSPGGFPVIGAAVALALACDDCLAPARLERPAAARPKGSLFLLCLVASASLMPVQSLPAPSWQSALALGFVSAFFDNIPLTALALKQGGYDWGVLAYAVGFGGSMIWFGSSAGVAICNMFPEARSTGRWLRRGLAGGGRPTSRDSRRCSPRSAGIRR